MPTTTHKRLHPHARHGETRVKPDAPPKPQRVKTYRKPLAIERYHETHAVLTDEQLDAVFDGLFGCGLVGGEA